MTEAGSGNTVFDDASDVTHSTAFVILNTLVDEGHIVEERADYLKQKFTDLHSRVLAIYKRDNLLLKRARKLRSQLDAERRHVQERGEQARKDDDEILLLKREVVELEKEWTSAQERESVLQVEALEMDRRKQNLILEREDALAAEEARIRPKIERTQQEICEMGEKVKEMVKTYEDLQAKKVELAKEEETLKTELGGFATVFAQAKQQYANIEQEPQRAEKQLTLVKRSLTAATHEAEVLEGKLKWQQETIAQLERTRNTMAQDLATAKAHRQKVRSDIESKRKTLQTLTASLEVEVETRQGFQDRLVELDLLVKTTRIAKNQEEDSVDRHRREKEKIAREHGNLLKQIGDANREQQTLKEAQLQIKRQLEELDNQEKALMSQIQHSKADLNAKRRRLLEEERRDKKFTERANVVLEDISNVEDMMQLKRSQEEAKSRELLVLATQRQELSRECAKEGNRELMTKEELRSKEVHYREVHRWEEELQKQLDNLTKSFQQVKRERSQMAAQIHAIAQKMTEVAEKTKILENELEVLLRECALKEKDLLKKKRQIHEITQSCTNLRIEKNKHRKRMMKARAEELEVKTQVRRINTELGMVEEDMNSHQKKYANAIDSRNHVGILLIDLNDEKSLLLEKERAQEAALRMGLELTNQREEQVARMRRRIADLSREVQVCYKMLPKVQELEEELRRMEGEVEDEAWRVEVLEKDLTDPNNPHRWRRIKKVLSSPGIPPLPSTVPPIPESGRSHSDGGRWTPTDAPSELPSMPRLSRPVGGSILSLTDVVRTKREEKQSARTVSEAAIAAAGAYAGGTKNCPSAEYVQLQAQCQDLEGRVNATNEKLREKDLILAEVTELADRIGAHAESGRAFTLALAKEVNGRQCDIRKETRSMMATVSELSLYQASSIQLQRQVQYLEGVVQVAEDRLRCGEAPFAEAEEEYQRLKLRNQRYREVLQRKEEEANAMHAATLGIPDSTALVRPNAYIPEDDKIGLPRPFCGSFLPYLPSQPPPAALYAIHPPASRIKESTDQQKLSTLAPPAYNRDAARVITSLAKKREGPSSPPAVAAPLSVRESTRQAAPLDTDPREKPSSSSFPSPAPASLPSSRSFNTVNETVNMKQKGGRGRQSSRPPENFFSYKNKEENSVQNGASSVEARRLQPTASPSILVSEPQREKKGASAPPPS